MAQIKLGKIPDRTPIKVTCTFTPDIHDMLRDYAKIYEQSYGAAVKPEALVPFIVDAFLASDSAFRRARKALTEKSSRHTPVSTRPPPAETEKGD